LITIPVQLFDSNNLAHVKAALVNAPKPSLPDEAFIPEVLCCGGKLAEGEGLSRDDIATGIPEN